MNDSNSDTKLKVQTEVDLSKYCTMRVGGKAQYLVEVHSAKEALEALSLARQKNLDFFVLSGGSNTIFTDAGFKGLVILNRIGLESLTSTESKIQSAPLLNGEGGQPLLDWHSQSVLPFQGRSRTSSHFKLSLVSNSGSDSGSGSGSSSEFIVEAGAGEAWDDLVKFSVENQLSGIEALSLIPGTVGAAPIQNIGAYGQQISDVVHQLEAIDVETLKLIKFKAQDCNFAYRRSRFNTDDKGKYLITSVQLKLKQSDYHGKLYRDVEAYFNKSKIDISAGISSAQLRKAVIEIRSNKLPDPAQVANTGSFFKNPIISEADFAKLKAQNPEVGEAPSGWSQPPFWQVEGGYKISAGWLVGQAGFSNFYDDDLSFGTWPKQDLVIYSKLKNPQYKNLQQFRNQLKLSVKLKFGIELQQEPEEVLQ